jgi:hypothetical protein
MTRVVLEHFEELRARMQSITDYLANNIRTWRVCQIKSGITGLRDSNFDLFSIDLRGETPKPSPNSNLTRTFNHTQPGTFASSRSSLKVERLHKLQVSREK